MDIDIDIRRGTPIRDIFPSIIVASMVQNGVIVKHNSGVYFQEVPVDPISGLSAIPFRDAEDIGFTKIDFLHLSLLNAFTSKAEIREHLQRPVDWSLLEKKEIVERLFHLGNHFRLVSKVKPKSLADLADCLALIRPGKKHLLALYLKDKEAARKELYKPLAEKGIYFKKSHSFAYAYNIILQLATLHNSDK